MSRLRPRLRRVAQRLLRRPVAPLEVRIPDGLLEAQRDGPLPLTGTAHPDQDQLDVAFVVPSFRQASGGHTTISRVIAALESRGHRCSVWILDDDARTDGGTDPSLAARFTATFGEIAGQVHAGFSEWTGADVVVATAWQTVPAVLRRPDVAARAYLVQDHEPEFFPTSAEREWATWSYRQGLHPIVASPWLEQVLEQQYGCPSTRFDIGIDHDVYRPQSLPRAADQVVFYARAVTARRGVPLGLLALEELHRRRPQTRIALFGEDRPIRTRFPHEHLGVRSRPELARTYAQATVGVVLSLTNPSLIPHEMLACGLPCVDLASPSSVAAHGPDSPIVLAEPTVPALCGAIEALLDDPTGRTQRSQAGIAHATAWTWDRTGAQVEAGLREALR